MKTTRPRTGLRAVRSKIQLKGLQAIDRRTGAAKHLITWKAELVAALGDPSPQQLALVELAARAKAVVDHVDHYILSPDSLINKRSRRVMPVVEQRTKLADHLAKLLSQLGLERRAKPVPSLDEYIDAKYGGKAEQDEIEHKENPDNR